MQTLAATLQVRPYRDADAAAWRQYLQNHPAATLFHRQAWSHAVQAAYGHLPLHLAAWTDRQLVGILPLFLVKSAFVGRVLVSVPYATYGGILADSDDVAKALLDTATQLAERCRVRYIELRHRESNSLELPCVDRYDTFRKALPDHPDQVLGWLPRKARAAARNGSKLLEADFSPENLDTIYDLYAVTLRRLGSPNYRRRFFHELQDAFGEDCVCLLIRDGGKPVAGVVSFIFRDEIVPYFSGSLPEGMARNANNVMYLRLMEHAVRQGIRTFDFNRTRRDNLGPHAFKRNMGFDPSPLHYQFHLNRADEIPNLSPGNRKFALAGQVWRRLPLPLVRIAGARLTQWIP